MALINNIQDIVFGNGLYVIGPKTGSGSTIIKYSNSTLSKWEYTDISSLLPVDTFISKTTYLNGEFFILANGLNICILKSSDAINWTLLYNQPTIGNALLSIDYGNNVYVASTFFNTTGINQMLVSDDTVTWTPISIDTDKPTYIIAPYRITFDGVKFVAVYTYYPTPQDSSSTTGILTSTDGSNWTIYQVPYATSGGQSFQRIACEYNSFTAVVWDGTDIYQSADITNPSSWTIVETAPTNVGNLKRVNGPFGNSYFLLGFDEEISKTIIKTSTNGITWAEHDYPFYNSEIKDVINIVGSKYAVIGDGDDVGAYYINQISTTEDFSYFTPYFAECYAIVENNGTYVTVGDYGTLITSNDGGDTWTYNNNQLFTVENYAYFNKVVYGNGTYVAVGYMDVNSRIMVTSIDDGQTWTVSDISALPPGSIYNIKFANSLFVSYIINYDDSTGYIITSPDGITWTERQEIINAIDAAQISYENSLFIITGIKFQKIYTSSDGITWDEHSFSENGYLSNVVYGNGVYVGGNVNNDNVNINIVYSNDGINWTAITTSESIRVYNVAYGNGLFIGSAQFGKILKSSDGINWTIQTVVDENYNIYSVKYLNNRFFLFNISNVDLPLLSSPDGNIWYIESFPYPTKSLYDMVFAGSNTFVSVGVDSLIYRKTNNTPPITPSATPILTQSVTPTVSLTPTTTPTPTPTITPTPLIDGYIFQSTNGVLNRKTDSNVNTLYPPNGFDSSGGVVSGGPFYATVTWLSGNFGSQDLIVRITGTDINGAITEDINVNNFSNNNYTFAGSVEFLTITGVTLLQDSAGGDGFYSVGTYQTISEGNSGCYIMEYRGGIATEVSATDPIAAYTLGVINFNVDYTVIIDRVANTGGRTFTIDGENILLDVGENHVEGILTHNTPPTIINVSGTGGTIPNVDIGYIYRFCPS